MGPPRINPPYTQVAADDMESPNGQLKPSVGDILRSKRVRLLGSAVFITLGLLFFFYGPSNDLTSGFDWNRCPSPSTVPAAPAADGSIDWSRYAYTQYVTNSAYLCNSIMVFEILHRLGSKADFLMMYPNTMSVDPSSTSQDTKLLLKAQKEYGVKLMPIEVQRRAGGDRGNAATWAESYTKLLAFNQTQYDRVLSLDSDSTILQTMDELFLLPACPVAMPRAYWLSDKPYLSSQLVLIQPSAQEFKRIEDAINTAKGGDFDMEIVNDLYGKDCMILPHRKYDLLTGEFRNMDSHENYLGNKYETWDPEAMLKEAKFLHFSDWPMPKPWINASPSVQESTQPPCVTTNGKEDCKAREMWNGFYSDFKDRRKRVCEADTKKLKSRSAEAEEEAGIRPRGAWEFIPQSA